MRHNITPNITLVLASIGVALAFNGFGLAHAENNDNLAQPENIGSISGIDEKDTYGVKYSTRTQYFILMNQGCSVRLCDEVVTGSIGITGYVGDVKSSNEKSTFGFIRQE